MFESSGAEIPSNVKGGYIEYEAGETLSARDLIYIADYGKAWKADASEPEKRPATAIVWSGGDAGESVWAIQEGIVPGYSGLTIDGYCYLSETAGELTQSAPAFGQVVGVAVSETSVSIDVAAYIDEVNYDGAVEALIYERFIGGL